jgi:serine/threonine protein kinase
MGTSVFLLFAVLLAIPLGIIAVLYLVVPFFKAVGWVVRQVFQFIAGEIGDALRIVGAVVTQAVLSLLVIGSILIGRWSASAHYGRALTAECKTMGLALYRVLIGHPARLLCLNNLVDGIERRIPEVVAAAPTGDTPKGRSGQFDGYRIIGSLPGGGSGGKLYIAEPDTMKLAIFERAGQRDVRQVVIKTFSLNDGSSLPQIVRESRALDAARRLGLVLEHELTNERFFYVTRYVPGESLGLVTQRLHAMSGGGDGLDEAHLRKALGYSADLLRTLHEYHRGGLWHKDVKPDNIIIDAKSAHLVDFGLITPLRSAMTLTTHGTEYFRDPELVRMALKGVKVHQVDGAKFDVYAAGAVLFSMIENSFPAHGGLSQISKRCPEALRWIVRRSMAEYAKRYPTAAEMLQDVEYVALAADPFSVKPFELPSMRGADAQEFIAEETIRRTPEPVAVGDGSGASVGFGPVAAAAAAAGAAAVGANAAGGPPPRGPQRPRIKPRSWWGGGASIADGSDKGEGERVVKVFPGVYVSGSINEALRAVGLGGEDGRPSAPPQSPWAPRHNGTPAKEQLQRARARAESARQRAQSRAHHRRHHKTKGDFKPFNAGVTVALLLFAGIVVGFFMVAFWAVSSKRSDLRVVNIYPAPEERGTAYASGVLLPLNVDIRPAGAASEASAPATASVEVRTSNSRAPQPRVVVQGTAAAPRLEEPFSPLSGGRILVISELQPPPANITAAIDRLRAGGANVMGNYPANPAGAEEIDRQVMLHAEAIMKRDLAQLDSDEASSNLTAWLAESGAADVLLWFARGDEKDSVRYYVYTPQVLPGQDREHSRHMATRSAVLHAVTNGSFPRAGR